MKKTNGRRRTGPHKRDVIGTNPKKQHRKEASTIVNNNHITWHDAQPSMMHVRFNEAWHGKVQQTTLQIKWSSTCNELHIDETPHQVIKFDLVYVPNNIKCC